MHPSSKTSAAINGAVGGSLAKLQNEVSGRKRKSNASLLSGTCTLTKHKSNRPNTCVIKWLDHFIQLMSHTGRKLLQPAPSLSLRTLADV